MSGCISSIKSSFYKIENYCMETVRVYKHQTSPKQREIILKTALVAIATLCVGIASTGGAGFLFSGVSTLAAFVKITRVTGNASNEQATNESKDPEVEPVSLAKAKKMGESLTRSQLEAIASEQSNSSVDHATNSLVEPVNFVRPMSTKDNAVTTPQTPSTSSSSTRSTGEKEKLLPERLEPVSIMRSSITKEVVEESQLPKKKVASAPEGVPPLRRPPNTSESISGSMNIYGNSSIVTGWVVMDDKKN